jgi:hypothetical protein
LSGVGINVKILFSWLQVGGVESVEVVPEFVSVVDFCGGSSVLEENSNVWSVWSDRIKSGGVGGVVGDLNKSPIFLKPLDRIFHKIRSKSFSLILKKITY